MNKQRRKAIDAIRARLDDLLAALDDIKDEEMEALENLPEPLQGSEKGEAMYTAIDNLENAFDNIQDALEYLEEATQ